LLRAYLISALEKCDAVERCCWNVKETRKIKKYINLWIKHPRCLQTILFYFNYIDGDGPIYPNSESSVYHKFFVCISLIMIPAVARSKAWVCSRLPAGIASSKPAEGMDVCLLWVLCVLSGRGLCDGLITRPEESCRVCCVLTVWSRNLKTEEAKTRKWVVKASKRRRRRRMLLYVLHSHVCILL
jgi:hypothetical protein